MRLARRARGGIRQVFGMGARGKGFASLFTTLLFVPLHLSMLALIPLTLLSLVLCLVREVHASITGPIAAHAMYNLTLLLGLAG